MSTLPLVGVSCCRVIPGTTSAFHRVWEGYLSALAIHAGAAPVLIPALGSMVGSPLLARVDGLLLTGSPSNVHPAHYASTADPRGPLDLHRDETMIPFIRAAVATGIPILAICRGMQELNVALGGSLSQDIHELPGRLDHRAPSDDSVTRRKYLPRHLVRCAPGGWLERMARESSIDPAQVAVNSLHAQAVDRLGTGARVEAWAPDGIVEAISIESPTFVVGVQWHPEHHTAEHPLYARLFRDFGRACAARARGRRTDHRFVDARVTT